MTILLQKRYATELAIGKNIVVWPWGNPFSFSNQLQHFFACPEREGASLRKIFLIEKSIVIWPWGNSFSFSNQLLHFVACPERERVNLRKIFLIMDYILPGCKGLFFIITDFEIILLRVHRERASLRTCFPVAKDCFL
jgi:quinol-cytochrome oxidoreductase complex cytochrome b subunit